MELATIDPHSQKEHIEIHKIPEFGVDQASFDFYVFYNKCLHLSQN